MNALSIDIKTLLEESSSGISFPVYSFHLPTEPDRLIFIRATGGFDSEVHNYRKPTFQIIIRGHANDEEEIYAEAENIIEALNYTGNFAVDTTRYIGIWMMGDLSGIMYENKGKKRPMLTMNFRVHRSE
jgi:hypothetical protein